MENAGLLLGAVGIILMISTRIGVFTTETGFKVLLIGLGFIVAGVVLGQLV